MYTKATTSDIASKVERICEQCGRHFWVYPSQAVPGRARFCSISCKARFRQIANGGSVRKSTGRYIKDGYVMVRVDDKWLFEHRIIAEKMLGRPLADDEEVHHLDENKQNNVPENLTVMTGGEHMRLHSTLTDRWSHKHEACVSCRTTQVRHYALGLCHTCYWIQQRKKIKERRAK